MSKTKSKKIPQTIDQLKQAGKTIHALVYCRVSSEKQKSEGHGLESQEARCRSYANSNGYILNDRMIFKDAASGGGSYKSRPGQVKMLAFIDQNPHMNFVVIIDDISRFARDVEAHFYFKYVLKDRGVQIVSPNFNFEDSPEGEVSEGIMAVISQYHRKGNKRQVIQKMTARLEQGYWPFVAKRGYDMVKNPQHGKICVPNNQGKKILKPALEAFANGSLVTKSDFCRHLIDQGFWKQKTVDRYLDQATTVLNDPFYAGIISYPEWEVIPRRGHHEPLISIETHEKILSRLLTPRATNRVRKDMTPDFPLRGLLKCSACGKHITAAWSSGRKKKYPYYSCLNHGCSLRHKGLARDIVEKDFKKLLKESRLKSAVDKIVTVVFDQVWKEELKALEKEEAVVIRSLKEKNDKLRDFTNLAHKAKSDKIRAVYESQMEELAEEIKESHNKPLSQMDTNVPYRTALRKSRGLVKSPYTVWQKLSLQEQRGLFFFIFDEKLAYDPKEGYRTAEIRTAAKLFEEFVVSNSDYVDPTGIEPVTSSLQMRRSSQMS